MQPQISDTSKKWLTPDIVHYIGDREWSWTLNMLFNCDTRITCAESDSHLQLQKFFGTSTKKVAEQQTEEDIKTKPAEPVASVLLPVKH